MGMIVRRMMNISVTPELLEFVAERVARGTYSSASEVVWAWLRALKAQELREEHKTTPAAGSRRGARGM
jgi:putative addiction module CopG family antidote